MIRLLVVDDMPVNLRLVRKALAREDFEVREARTGAEALEAAAASRPDVVLLDLRLGEGEQTGFELVKRFRSLPGWERTPIIALSGGAVLEDEEATSAAGFDGFLSKPFDVAALPGILRAYVARPADPAAG